MANRSDDRFVVVYSQIGSINGCLLYEVLVDRATGVNYLFCQSANNAGGLTVLMDREGKPLITPVG